jgi:hypothetical protein
MRNALAMLALILLTLAAVIAGDIGLTRVETAQALQCARESDGTDMAICNCYIERGLDIPEDMK